ncbi:MAG: NAD-dependent epimerase/dehydratase family protein, partial [Candidatus Korarchaeum sp.]
SYRIVVLGTDACIGKRTTAWMLADELNGRGIKAVFIGTGQTAWMQGAKYGIVLDAMINDFITGGLEHEVWRAYVEERPDVIIVPGQGAMLHPAFPGSFEIVNLLSPQAVILQHAPGRKHLEDFPEFPMPPLEKYIRLVELMTDRKPVAITVNTEGMSPEEVEMYIEEVERKYGIVACAPLMHGVSKIADLLAGEIKVGLEVLR